MIEISTLVYSPRVWVKIQTSKQSKGKGSIIDVTEDISSWSVTRVSNGISSARVSLLNQSRKYDGYFNTMDKIVVYERRIKKVLKFSGYLDQVPKWSAEPGSVNLSASCTLKRLANFLWDPGSDAAQALMGRQAIGNEEGKSLEDGGIAQKVISLMTEVPKWPEAQIHIGQVPTNWFDQLNSIMEEYVADAERLRMVTDVGAGSWMAGENPVTSMTSTIQGIGPGTGKMPASVGKCSQFGGPSGGAYGNFGLTGESGVSPNDYYFSAMRWPYTDDNAVSGAKKWWTNRKILVVNPKNNKACVVRAADWGPAKWTGRVIDLGKDAMKALGANTDDVLHMGFAPAGSKVGPAQSQAASGVGSLSSGKGAVDAASAATSTGAGASGHSSGWGSPGSNQVSARGGGCSFTCHRQAKVNFEGFLNDLVNILGYHPKSVGGYNNRNIAGSGTKSNHAYGAAIDIDPGKNPRLATSKRDDSAYALPKPPAIINLARKWGLGWGGEYRNSKDYMHFEVIGAPASDVAAYKSYKGGPVGPVVPAKWKPPIHKPYTVTNKFGDAGPYANRHTGTDFACPSGTPIYPVGPGKVHDKGTGHASYGNWCSIDHGAKYFTFYAHQVSPSPAVVGSHVDTDTVIGHVGQTGNASGPHCHLELRHPKDEYHSATNIEPYVLGGKNRKDPPAGTEQGSGDFSDATSAGVAPQETVTGQGLFNVWQYEFSAEAGGDSNKYGGYRAILNDVPVLDTISEELQSTLRDYCSAPNGDFIAWFPDYFGHYKQAGKMVISPLEIDLDGGPPTIGQSDSQLKTHQFVSSASGPGRNNASSPSQVISSAGIASVENTALMKALLNITDEEATYLATDYLERMGARSQFTPMNNIGGNTNGSAKQEFFFACQLFQRNWTRQFQASINLTFMPEIFPGMLVCFPIYGVQGYCVETTDSGDATGGFRTSVTLAPWSTIGKTDAVISGLPVGAPL